MLKKFGACLTTLIAACALTAAASPEKSPEYGQGLVGSTGISTFEITPMTALEKAGYTQYATEHSLPVADVVRNFEFADDFRRAADLLQATFPQQFSDTQFQTLDGKRAAIYFVGDVPAVARDLVKTLPIPVELVGGHPLTRDQRVSAMDAFSEVLEKSAGTQSSDTWIDAGSLVINVNYSGGPTEITPELAQQLVQIANAAAGTDLPFTINAKRFTERVFTPEVLSGGTKLNRPGEFDHWCTAGFTVRNSRTGQTGLLTASHCPDNLQYENRSGVLTFQGHMDASETDAQWFSSTNEGIWGKFVWKLVNGQPQLATVSGTSGVGYGDPICKFGLSTNYGCTTVRAPAHAMNDPESHVPLQVAVAEDYITAGGDSGGPWFNGNTAEGIHGGKTDPISFKSRSYFTLVQRVQAYSDLRVRIG